ncbi:MAG: class I SAM-dependent methyltransferase [archaeon]
MNDNVEGWERRKVDFSRIHGDDSEAYHSLLNNLGLREGMLVVDLMGGYGAVSQKVLEYCESKGIWANLMLLDAYSTQLDMSREILAPYEAKGHSVVRILEDARNYPFSEGEIDKVIVKMGLHEVGRDEQQGILERAIASLKQNGDLFVWESVGKTPKIRDYFRKIVRKKDELAGYRSLAENRYFCYEEELIGLLEGAGGQRIARIYDGDFNLATGAFCEADFGGDVEKLREWNEYIRSVVPLDVAETIRLHDSNDSLEMRFDKKIFQVGKGGEKNGQ